MAAKITLQCFDCGSPLSFATSIGRRDECDRCGADVHVCKNCRFYDPSAYNECREPTADPVQEKERANFCEHFTPGDSEGGDKKPEALKAAAEALFKK